MADDDSNGVERRRGSLEFAQALGSLQATVQALANQSAERHAENITRHTETIGRITDIQSQVHEVKHNLNNERVIVGGLVAKVEAHQLQDKLDHDHVISTLDSHQEAAAEALTLVRQEVVSNRSVAANRMDEIMRKQEEFSSFKYRLIGAGTLAGILVTAVAGSLGLGKLIVGMIAKAWHAVSGQ